MKSTNAAVFMSLGMILTALSAPLPVAAQAGSPHAISLYNLGLTAYKQGSPESAIIFFKRACDIDPNLADAQYNLGVLYQSQKRIKEAVPRFQEVIRVKPSDPDAHYQLALCLTDLGQLQDARANLSAIPPNDPHFADAQKRIHMIDQGVAIPSISQASQPPSTPNYPSSTSPDSVDPSTNGGMNGAAYQAPPQNVQIPTQQFQQPTQTYQQIPAQTSGQIGQVASVPPSSPRTVAAPTPILANTSVRVIATGFSAPAGLAFDRSGNLYVANFTSNTVDRINADGSRSQFSSGTNLKGPIGLAVDGSGNLYVANYTGGTIARISPAGISTIVANGFRKPYYLTLDKDGNLFVSQQEDNSIVRISLPRANVKPTL